MYIQRASVQVGSITTTLSATAYNTASDERLKPKRELLALERARDTIDALEVYDYDFAGNTLRGVGLIAQQAHAVNKAFASPPAKDGETWMIEKAAPMPYVLANLQLINDQMAAIQTAMQKLVEKVNAMEGKPAR
jgi:hypothetical protein